MSSKHKAELETELGQLRAKLSADKQEAMMALRRELDDKLLQQKGEFIGKIDKLLMEMKSKEEESEKMRLAKNTEIADLQAKVRQMEAQFAGQLGGQEQILGSLSAEASALRDAQSKLQSALSQRDLEVANLRRQVSDKDINIAKLEKELQAAQQEIHRLRQELDALYKSGADLEQDLKNRLLVSNKEAESFRAEINQMGSALAAVRDDLKRAEKVHN